MNYSRNNGARGLVYLLIFFFLTLITYNVIYYNSTKLSSLNSKLESINQKIKEIEQINDTDSAIISKKEKLISKQKLEEQDRIKEKPINANTPTEIARNSQLLKSNFEYTGLTTSVWQTSPGKVDEKIHKLMNTWKQVPGWSYTLVSNYAVKDYIRTTFPKLNITKILEEEAILIYDLFRYSIIYQQGGIYADFDVQKADQFQDSMTNLRDCNVIVGIEGDLRNDPQWMNKLPRSLQIAQWSFYAKERHPMMKYVVDRIAEKIWWLQQKKKNLHNEDVMEVTGPGIWTDAVVDYIAINAGININDYMKCGLSYRFGDVCVLNVKAFASTMPHSDCKTETNENSYIVNTHHFLGSWAEE